MINILYTYFYSVNTEHSTFSRSQGARYVLLCHFVLFYFNLLTLFGRPKPAHLSLIACHCLRPFEGLFIFWLLLPHLSGNMHFKDSQQSWVCGLTPVEIVANFQAVTSLVFPNAGDATPTLPHGLHPITLRTLLETNKAHPKSQRWSAV